MSSVFGSNEIAKMIASPDYFVFEEKTKYTSNYHGNAGFHARSRTSVIRKDGSYSFRYLMAVHAINVSLEWWLIGKKSGSNLFKVHLTPRIYLGDTNFKEQLVIYEGTDNSIGSQFDNVDEIFTDPAYIGWRETKKVHSKLPPPQIVWSTPWDDIPFLSTIN